MLGNRKGKVQLIDATQWYRPLRKNLGDKNCELSDEDIRRICDAYLAFEETGQSKIFRNEAFGYWKVTVERPLRLTVELSPERRQGFRDACRGANEEPLANVVDRVAAELGPGPHRDFNRFMASVAADAAERGVRMTAKRKTLLKNSLAHRDEAAEPVVRKGPPGRGGRTGPGARPVPGHDGRQDRRRGVRAGYRPARHRAGAASPRRRHRGVSPARGAALRARRLVCPVPASKVGYEISFTRHFYKPQPLRPLEEIRADILALERETEGLLAEIVVAGGAADGR